MSILPRPHSHPSFPQPVVPFLTFCKLKRLPAATPLPPSICIPTFFTPTQHPPIPSIQPCPTPPEWTSSQTSLASTISNHLPCLRRRLKPVNRTQTDPSSSLSRCTTIS